MGRCSSLSQMRVSSSRYGLIAALILSLVLVGCSAPPEPTATAIPELLKTPRPTFTPIPTATPVPAATLAPTATPVPPTATPEATSTPDALVNPLSGLRVADEALLQRRPLAVRVGNDESIRPQEGLGQAEIVYEELMEGQTLTRFTAIFYAADATRIRPIRSARLVSLSIAPQYDAALVHSGASDKIRWLIAQADFVDLDQYFHPDPYGVLGGYDWRGRMYTSVQQVHAYLAQQGLERQAPIAGYTFAADAPTGAAAAAIHIPYPALCVVDWTYDAASGRYMRKVQGQPHLEGLTSEPIGAENVIILYAAHEKTDIVEDSLGSTAIDIVLKGSGRVQVMRDGVVVAGEWRQTADNPLIQFYDAQGRLIPLKPGQTWIELVPPDYQVAF